MVPAEGCRSGGARVAAWALVRLLRITLLLPGLALASGPRFVTGPPFFTGPSGVAIGWKQSNLLYYTDPGSLSATVDHQAADALVAAAAGVWNVPVASITVGRGGALAEHVSGQNVYLDSTGMNFPADVMSTNAAAVPVAIVYDTDGSVTDTLLGQGASGPTQCRQNAVTESVDSFDRAGYILHAVIVLNGRCIATLPQSELDMQYKLERAFGRVLGLAWSQTNDNVFTGVPQPTYDQALNWPVMHPIDIICGTYSYQCMVNPFQPRADDVASMVALYPIPQNAVVAAGKQPSYTYASEAQGTISFSTGQGMAGVNVLVARRPPYSAVEPWFETSAVTGSEFRRAATSPFVIGDTSALGSQGSLNGGLAGQFSIAYTPIDPSLQWQTLVFSTEAVNPLYIGSYSLGPYSLGNVAPSGSSPQPQGNGVDQQWGQTSLTWTIADSASTCSDGSDGTASAPMQVPSPGWWNGVLCGYGHASNAALEMQGGRSFTVEVTALDAQGLATESKAMPVIGLYAANDAPGDLPSLGVAPTAFDGRGAGTTTIHSQTGAQSGQSTRVRIGIADQRGEGRPDFTYQARLFYADTVFPTQISTSGGEITIAGYGFRAGNAVSINGVAAGVVSVSSNTIVVRAPALAGGFAVQNTAVDVTVSDISTGASSTMTAALTYSSAPNTQVTMKLVSAPSAPAYVGDALAVPFAVQLLGADGTTPVAGAAVVFSASAGSVRWAACGGATCVVMTDANGMAFSAVTPLTAGSVTIQAADGSVVQSASFAVTAQAASMVVVSAPTGNLPVTLAAATPFTIRVLAANGSGMAGRPVTFSVPTGSATFGGCFTQTCTLVTDGSGTASASITPVAVGPVTLLATDGDTKQSVSFTAVGDQDTMQVFVAPTAHVFVGDSAGGFAVRLFRFDGTPDYGQQVLFTAPDGIIIEHCASTVCAMGTDGGGVASVLLTAHQVGVFSIKAVFGSLSQTVLVTCTEHSMSLRIVTAPSGNVPIGVTSAVPFSAQLLEDGITPAAGYRIGVNGPEDSVALNSCGIGLCALTTDSNGMVSTLVTPLKPGVITLSAIFAPTTVTASFTATGSAETMRVLAQPGPGGVLVGDTADLAIQLIGSDGVTVYPNKLVRITVANGSFGIAGCDFGVCQYRSDSQGMVAFNGVAVAAGGISIQAADDLTSQTISFNASSKPDVLSLISAPASGGYAGTTAAFPFAVQVLFADGITPAPGRSVTVRVTSGVAGFAACGGSASCVLQTGPAGTISTAVTPLSGGSITLSASEAGVTQTATFTAFGVPEAMQIVSVPANGSAVGSVAPANFSVRVVGSDGVTPLPGRSIALSVTNGNARLGACGLAACTVVSDARGLAATTVTPLAAGMVSLLAADGSVTQAATFNAAVYQYSLLALNPAIFIAEGATLRMNLVVAAGENGSASIGQSVRWAASQGFALAATDGITSGDGTAGNPAVLGPLAASAQAATTACAWVNVCAKFTATGVAADTLRIALTSGAGQSVSAGAALAAVVATVTDGSGNPVAGAAVAVSQAVTALDANCPDRGRCPAAAVILTKATVLVSGSDGTVTVTPISADGVAGQTEMALSVGTQGFATAVLTARP